MTVPAGAGSSAGIKYIFGGEDVEVRTGTVPKLVPGGTLVSVFADPGGMIPATGLKTLLGSDITALAINGESQIPLFYRAVDDLDTIYVSIAGGPVTPIYARSDERLDLIEDRVDTLEGDQTVAVFSVNGQTPDESGAVTISKGGLGLGSVDNTPDTGKPVSTAQAAAITAAAGAVASAVAAEIGSLSALTTTAKGTVVAAINEVNAKPSGGGGGGGDGTLVVPIPGVDFDYNQVSAFGELLNAGEDPGFPFIFVGDGVHTWDDGGGGALAMSRELTSIESSLEILVSNAAYPVQGPLDFGDVVLINRSGAYIAAAPPVADGYNRVGIVYGVEATILIDPAGSDPSAHPELLNFMGAEVLTDYTGTGSALITASRLFVSITNAPDTVTPAAMPEPFFVGSDIPAVAAQTTVDGKLMYLTPGLVYTDDDGVGHLFIGYGDYDQNTGPLDVISINLETSEVETQLTAWHTEQYNHIRVDPFNAWWIPSIDPRGSENATFATNGDGDPEVGVSDPRVVTITPPVGLGPLVHCFDLTFIVNWVDGTTDGTFTILAVGARDMIPSDRHYVADGGMACVWEIDRNTFLADDSTPWTEVMQATIADDGVSAEDGFSRFYWIGDLDTGQNDHWVWLAHPSSAFSGICREPDGTWHTLGIAANFDSGVPALIPTFTEIGDAGLSLLYPYPDSVSFSGVDAFGAPFFAITGRFSGNTSNGYRFSWQPVGGSTSPGPTGSVTGLRQYVAGYESGVVPLPFDPSLVSLLAYKPDNQSFVARWSFDGPGSAPDFGSVIEEGGQLVSLATNGGFNPQDIIWNRLVLPDVDEDPAPGSTEPRLAPLTCAIWTTAFILCDGRSIWLLTPAAS